MRIYFNNIDYWKSYEASKNKETINFEKNKKMKSKFEKLLEEMKRKVNV